MSLAYKPSVHEANADFAQTLRTGDLPLHLQKMSKKEKEAYLHRPDFDMIQQIVKDKCSCVVAFSILI